MTASDTILEAYSRLVIRQSESSLEPDEIQDGLKILNDLLAVWGPLYGLGASPVDKVSDVIRIPRWADAAFKDELAILIAPHFGKVVPDSLVRNAVTSKANMANMAIFIGDVDMPSTLPKGSGNECFDDGTDRRFFAEKDKGNF